MKADAVASTEQLQLNLLSNMLDHAISQMEYNHAKLNDCVDRLLGEEDEKKESLSVGSATMTHAHAGKVGSLQDKAAYLVILSGSLCLPVTRLKRL